MKTRIPIFALAVIGALLGMEAGAHPRTPSCDCTDLEFENSKQLLELSSWVGDIAFSDALLSEQGRADWLLTESLSLKLKSQRAIPRHCEDRLTEEIALKTSRLRVHLSVRTRPDPKIPDYSMSPWDLLNKYQAMEGFAPQYCTQVYKGADAESCIGLLSPSIQRITTSAIENPGPSNPWLWADAIKNMSESDLHVLRAYDRFLKSANADESVQWAADGRLGLENNKEKQIVLQVLGEQLHQNYDDARAIVGSDASKKKVSDDELLASARKASHMPSKFSVDAQVAKDLEQSAGVCRDIAAYLARIASALGMKNVYILAFATQGSQHTTLSYQFQDSEDSTEIQRQNYGRVTQVSQSDGGAASTTLTDDVPTHIRIYGPKGNMQSVVTTSLGKVLQEGTGFAKSATDDVLKTRDRESLFATEILLERSWHDQHSAKAFMGRTEENAYVFGLGYDFQRGIGSNFPTRAGAAVAAIQADPGLLNQDLSHSPGGMLQLNLEQKVQTDRITMGKDASLQLGIHGTIDGAVGLFNGEGLDLNGQADIRAGAEATIRAQSADGNFKQKTTLGVTSAIGQEDIRDAYLFTPQFLSSYIQATQSLKISPDLTAFTELTLAHSRLSNRGKIETGVLGERYIASSSLSGRLDKDDPLLEDNSLRRVAGQIQYRTSQDSNLGFQVSAPIEGNNRLRATQVGADFKVNF